MSPLRPRLKANRWLGLQIGTSNMATQILIVDDDGDARDIVALQLQMLGYDVIEARSGEEAVEKALGQKPKLVIMDLRLPGISGIEAATRLKDNAATRHIPVVAHTAWDKLEFKDGAKNAGMVEFLVKPVSAQQWNKVLQRLLETKFPNQGF